MLNKQEDCTSNEIRPLLVKEMLKHSGLVYMVLVVITNITADAISQCLLETTTVFLVAMMRGLTMVLLIIPVLLFYSISLKDSLSEWKLLSLRGIASTISVLTRVAALCFSPLGNVTAVIAVTPIVTALWSWILLAEAVSINEMGFAVLSAIGVCLIAQPHTTITDYGTYYGTGFAVFSCIFASLGIVLNRKVSQRDIFISPFVQVFYYGAISTCLNLTAFGISIPTLPQFSFPTWQEWLLLIAVGFASLLKQTFLTLALKDNEAIYVSTFTYAMSIVAAFVIQYTFFHDIPTLLTLIGSFLCIFATVGCITMKLYC
ncbi:solute carrier family 35 member G1-like [Apostichopus japonicus]|uniref:solute carrier family 35 member G1-like n=1 Tax=Stichopus japonicus TaxID=307972 RepID=UPI003AB58F68